MAAALARMMLADAGAVCAVESAGVAAFDDSAASNHAVTVMEENGCDLLTHRSKRVSNDLVTQATLILTMTSAHRNAVILAHPNEAYKVFLLNEYAGEIGEVADPFGGDCDLYRTCAAQIKLLLTKSIKKYLNKV
jgi:protein-tyrosine-phosphatase